MIFSERTQEIFSGRKPRNEAPEPEHLVASDSKLVQMARGPSIVKPKPTGEGLENDEEKFN